MILKQIKPGYFALHVAGENGAKLHPTLARAFFSHIAKQLSLVA